MLEGVVPWPEQAAELYRKLGYWRGEPIGDRFDRSIAENAARLAIVDGERRITYSQLGAMVERLAASSRAGASSFSCPTALNVWPPTSPASRPARFP